MKIVFCTYDQKNMMNGVNSWLLRLLPLLKKAGIDVSVIYASPVNENECTTIPLLKAMDIDCKKINSARYTEDEVKCILEYVKVLQPDIFVANSLFQALYASKWIRDAGIPTIGVLHSDNEESAEAIKEFIVGQKEFALSGMVAVSDLLFKKINGYGRHTVVKRIPCGVHIPAEMSAYNKGNAFKIAYVGRLEKHPKRIDKITRAFCEVVTTLPNIEAYIFGNGFGEDIVHNIIKEFNNPANILVKGNLPNEELLKELLNVHVVTLMSEHEGLPISLMEAMAAGAVPVCTYISSGLPELLIDKFTGLYVENNSDYRDKIKSLSEDPAYWGELSSNAKSHINKGFSIEDSTRQWIGLFNELFNLSAQIIKVPNKIKLPEVNVGLSVDNNRRPGLFTRGYRRVKRLAKT